MLVFSLATELIMGPREDPDTDRIADVRHGARLDSGDAPGDLSPSAPGSASWNLQPAALGQPENFLPGSLGLSPLQIHQEQAPWLLPLAAENTEALADAEAELSQEERRARGELGASERQSSPSNLPVSPGPLPESQRKPLHNFAGEGARPQGASAPSSGEHTAAASGTQELHYRGEGSPGTEAWQEQLQLRTLPNGNVLLVVQLQISTFTDGTQLGATDTSTAADQTEDPETEDAAKLTRRQRVKKVAAPLLPALQQALAQAVKEDAKAELEQKVRSYVRQRPGGVQLVVSLDEASLRQLAATLGPRFPQIRKLLEVIG